jgi:large subunit ribosomal protein L20
MTHPVSLATLRYSHFIAALNTAEIGLNRKVLADLAVTEPYSFKAVVETVRLAAPKEDLA